MRSGPTSLRRLVTTLAAVVLTAITTAFSAESRADDTPPAPAAGAPQDVVPPAPGPAPAPGATPTPTPAPPSGSGPGVGAAIPNSETPADPAAPDGWAGIPVVTLHEAAAAGAVDASGRDPASYQQVTLRVRNRTKTRQAVDIAGSHVTPRGKRCQRLGIGPAVTPSGARAGVQGKLVLRLEPDAETEIRVWTCCLDSGLPAPSFETEFGASSKRLPEVRETVLRWWVDNPTAPQSAVNQAIWTNAAKVHVGAGIVENYSRPKGRFAAVHRGVFYRLEDGRLTSIDPDGTARIHGSEVFQVLPTDDGLFAVALGEDRAPKLWQIPVTAENGWRKVLDLDGTMRIRDVIAAGRGDMVLVTDKGILWFDAAKKELRHALDSELFAHLSVRRDAADRLLVTILRPKREPIRQGGDERLGASQKSEIWSLSLATGKTERVEEFWNVDSILAGPAGVFSLSHTQGRLRRFDGKKFSDFGPETRVARILEVARDLVWLVGADEKLFAVDVKTRAVRHRTSIDAKGDVAFDVDPENGDVAWVAGERFHVLRAADGVETTIE